MIKKAACLPISQHLPVLVQTKWLPFQPLYVIDIRLSQEFHERPEQRYVSLLPRPFSECAVVIRKRSGHMRLAHCHDSSMYA